MAFLARILLFLLPFLSFYTAQAHEVRPAYLEITEIAPDDIQVIWKQPIKDGMRLRIDPVFPDDCVKQNETIRPAPGALIRTWTMACDAFSKPLKIQGLEHTLVDVFVRIKRHDGTQMSAVLRPSNTVLDLTNAETPTPPAAYAYLRLGVEHIIFGYDHVLFVVGIALLVRRRQLLGAVTAFTIAHSITLALSALAGVTLPGPPVEIVIALSIALLGVETLYAVNGRETFGSRMPWMIAFGFGLIHGFGFAGALANIGLPDDARAFALFLFNVGVELGQIAILAALLILAFASNRLVPVISKPSRIISAYAIMSVGLFWAIERVIDTFA